jgi:SAM-dependent methyltransferase
MSTGGQLTGAAHPGRTPQQDEVNRSTWRAPGTVASYLRLQGWTDPGEEAAIERVAQEVRAQPILDIGMGTGRTTNLLRALSGDYLGIDYTAEMVEAARQAHPYAHFEHMDARDLGALPAGHFALAVFSFNGIDSVAPADRLRVLREVHRVLRPGGLFVVSAHNRHGPGMGERPRLHVPFSWNPLRLAWRLARSLRTLPAALRNHRRLRAANEVHDDWAVLNCGAHDFNLLVVYTSLAAQQRQLAACGFTVEAVFGNDSAKPVEPGDDPSPVWWYHYVARKAPHAVQA